jgi:alkylation response protein AidB-like acyl-CoA dehydrogenase
VTFAFTDEQDELRRMVRAFLAETSPEAEVRRLMETPEGYDAAIWRRLAGELGLTGLAIGEEYGGAGYGFVELGVVLEEAGRALLCAPLLSSVVLAGSMLANLDDEAARREYLPGIAGGETTATLALTEGGGRWDARGVQLAATRGSQGWTLDGTKTFVLDGWSATLILVAARTGAGVSVFAVDGDAPGLRRTTLATLDQTRKQARLDFATTPARLIGTEGAAWPAIARTLDLAAIALAAEQVGGAQRVLDMAVEYAKTRVQFGRPIGSFQAIKHKLADVLVEVESARSAAYHGLWTAARATGPAASGSAADGSAAQTGGSVADPAPTADDDLALAASIAKAYCSEAYAHAAADNIQVHGGIGFTWEHPAHLYLKRARSSLSLFGDPTLHRERVAQRLTAAVPAAVPASA